MGGLSCLAVGVAGQLLYVSPLLFHRIYVAGLWAFSGALAWRVSRQLKPHIGLIWPVLFVVNAWGYAYVLYAIPWMFATVRYSELPQPPTDPVSIACGVLQIAVLVAAGALLTSYVGSLVRQRSANAGRAATGWTSVRRRIGRWCCVALACVGPYVALWYATATIGVDALIEAEHDEWRGSESSSVGALGQHDNARAHPWSGHGTVAWRSGYLS